MGEEGKILTNISSILQHKKTQAGTDAKKQRTLIHNGPRGFSARTFVLDKGFSQTQIVNAEMGSLAYIYSTQHINSKFSELLWDPVKIKDMDRAMELVPELSPPQGKPPGVTSRLPFSSFNRAIRPKGGAGGA